MSRVASREIHRDSEPLITGTHKGSDGSAFIYDKGRNFRSLGADPVLLLYVENETQSSHGYLSASTEDTLTALTPSDEAAFILGAGEFPYTFGETVELTWDYGDTYNIYKTISKDKFISDQWQDVSRGWKINNYDEVNEHGWRHDDWDIDDRGRKKVFGPGQPE